MRTNGYLVYKRLEAEQGSSDWFRPSDRCPKAWVTWFLCPTVTLVYESVSAYSAGAVCYLDELLFPPD